MKDAVCPEDIGIDVHIMSVDRFCLVHFLPGLVYKYFASVLHPLVCRYVYGYMYHIQSALLENGTVVRVPPKLRRGITPKS